MYNFSRRPQFASHNWPDRHQWNRDKIDAPRPYSPIYTQRIFLLKINFSEWTFSIVGNISYWSEKSIRDWQYFLCLFKPCFQHVVSL